MKHRVQAIRLESGDSPQACKHFLGGNRLAAFGLSDRFLQYRLKLGRYFKGFIRFAREYGYNGAFRQGFPFHDDFTAHDSSSG